jgi:ATP-binding cassette subfamily B protein
MTTPSTIQLPPSSPSAAFQAGIIGLYKAFWRHAAGNRPLVAVFLSLLFLAQAIRLAIPWYFGQSGQRAPDR